MNLRGRYARGLELIAVRRRDVELQPIAPPG